MYPLTSISYTHNALAWAMVRYGVSAQTILQRVHFHVTYTTALNTSSMGLLCLQALLFIPDLPKKLSFIGQEIVIYRPGAKLLQSSLQGPTRTSRERNSYRATCKALPGLFRSIVWWSSSLCRAELWEFLGCIVA